MLLIFCQKTCGFFFLYGLSARPSANMPWDFFSVKMIRYKIKTNYAICTIVAVIKLLNQTYSEIVGTFNEWGVNALMTQESFLYLEKSQSISGAEGGREASLQIAQMLNLVFGKKVGVPF